MTCNYTKSTYPILVFSFSILILFFGISVGINPVFGENDGQNDFVVVTSENLSNDPLVAKILENIEKSKKEFSDMQKKSIQEDTLKEQRIIAKDLLDKELDRMFKDNEEYTPLASFNKFLKTIPNDNTKIIFSGLFDYKEKKVDAARNALHEVLRNGGTLQEARSAYYEAAKIPRSDMIQLVTDLNIKAGFSDPKIQNQFDKAGKLPRFDDEQTSIISFVDLTSSSRNLNSSTESELSPSSTTDTSSTSSKISEVTTTNRSENNLIQKLLEEIENLKNKIKDLEKIKDPALQQVALFDKKETPIIYASWLLDFSQGKGHKDSSISTIKSIPINALNSPNSHTDENNSLSLGRQGQVTLGFSEPVSEKLIIFETSPEKNITELATIEVSLDGKNWNTLKQTQYYHDDDSYVHEYNYDISDIGCISHVRIIDNSPSIQGDGFDVDAIGATQKCNTSS